MKDKQIPAVAHGELQLTSLESQDDGDLPVARPAGWSSLEGLVWAPIKVSQKTRSPPHRGFITAALLCQSSWQMETEHRYSSSPSCGPTRPGSGSTCCSEKEPYWELKQDVVWRNLIKAERLVSLISVIQSDAVWTSGSSGGTWVTWLHTVRFQTQQIPSWHSERNWIWTQLGSKRALNPWNLWISLGFIFDLSAPSLFSRTVRTTLSTNRTSYNNSSWC